MPNVRMEMREAKCVDLSRRIVVMGEGDNLPYDVLVVATGAETSYSVTNRNGRNMRSD
jgi:NADH dehydrogenase